MQASSDPSVDPPRIVLKPKLRAPLPRPEHVVRRRLLELLRYSLEFKVSLISAPTGYGKTTLLAHWRQVEETNLPFAWVSLDEQDNHPIRLWRHIVESLGQSVPGGESGSAVLTALSVTGARVVDTVVPMLVNELGEVPQKVTLVLDDYQFATDDGCL